MNCLSFSCHGVTWTYFESASIMNPLYLQFVFAMVLVINGILCDSDPEVLHCKNCGNDGTETFTVAACDDNEEYVLQNVSLDVNARITCGASDSWYGETLFSFKIVCPDEWQILLRVSPMDIDNDIVVKAFPDEEEEEHSISNNTGPIILLSKDNILEIHATFSGYTMQNKMFMLSVWTVKVVEQIEDQSDCEVNRASGGPMILVSCTTPSSYDIALISFDDGNQPSFTVICWFGVGYQPTSMRASCSRMPGTLQVELTLTGNINMFEINLDTLCFALDPSIGSRSVNPTTIVTTIGPSQPNSAIPMTPVTSNTPLQPTFVNPMTTDISNGSSQPTFANPTATVTSKKTSQRTFGKSNSASIVVPIVVVLVAVFLIVALAATIWRKRRNKRASAHAENVSANNGPYLHDNVSSEGGDATDKSPRYVTSNARPERDGTVDLNIRSTVNQNEGTVVYNEIGEQDYNTLFGGKERDDYHEYNVPDRPQERTSVDRTRASGSGPYQELLPDGTRAVAVMNRSPEVTGPRHGVADDLHAYQDLRQDDRSVSGSHPNGKMPNQLPSKDTPAEQNDQSMTGTSEVSEPPSDKQYDTLQRSINTVGQPPSAGYGTLKPMNETDADYESPNVKPKTTSDCQDATRPTEALPINQPKARHSVSYDDDDYQTPIKPAEDLMNAYQTLDNPGYQQEPDTQAEEYSHLQRSLGAKRQSHRSSNQDNSDSYGKLQLNGTP